MKKNLKTGILALALVASATGVFARDIADAISGKQRVDYQWQRIGETSQLPYGPIVTSDTNPFPEDCNGDSPLKCAKGTPASGPVEFVYYPG